MGALDAVSRCVLMVVCALLVGVLLADFRHVEPVNDPEPWPRAVHERMEGGELIEVCPCCGNTLTTRGE